MSNSNSADYNDFGRCMMTAWKKNIVYTLAIVILPILGITLAYNLLAVFFYSDYLIIFRDMFLFWSLLFYIFFLHAWYRHVQTIAENLLYTQIASEISYSYKEYDGIQGNSQLYSMGTPNYLMNVLYATHKDVPVRIGNFSYSGGGRYSLPNFTRYIFADMEVNASFPHIVCIPRKWTSIGSSIIWNPIGNKELHLEGDFNSKFFVSAPEGKEIESLQVLEPNVMESLMVGFEEYGFEIHGKYVFLFTHGVMSKNPNGIIRLHEFIERFCDLMLPELQKFSTDFRKI